MIRLDCTDPHTSCRGKPPSFDMSLPLPGRYTDNAVLGNYPGNYEFQLIAILFASGALMKKGNFERK